MAKKTARKVAVKKVAKKVEIEYTGDPAPNPAAAPIIAHVVRTSIPDKIQAIIDEIAKTRSESDARNIALTNLRKSIVWLNR